MTDLQDMQESIRQIKKTKGKMEIFIFHKRTISKPIGERSVLFLCICSHKEYSLLKWHMGGTASREKAVLFDEKKGNQQKGWERDGRKL